MSSTIITTGLSSNTWATNEKPIDMSPKMYKNFPQQTPILAITSKLSEGTTSQSRVDWTEQEEVPTEVWTTSATAAAGTTLGISADYTYLRNHDTLYNPDTGERLKVQDTAIDATVSVVKGWAGTTDAAVKSNQRLVIMSSAYHEGADERNPRQVTDTDYYNLTQEIDEYIRTSKRVMNEASHFGGKGTKRTENQGKLLQYFKKKFEYTLLFGKRADTVSTQTGYTSNYIKTMDGIEARLRDGTNYFNVNGILTESMFDGFLTDVYTTMPSTGRLALVASPKIIGIINQMCKPLIRLSPNSKKYGMQLNQYFGAIALDLIPHPLLKGPDLQGMGFLLDFEYIKLRYQYKPELQRDVYLKSANFVEDKMYALATMMLANEKRHGMLNAVKG